MDSPFLVDELASPEALPGGRGARAVKTEHNREKAPPGSRSANPPPKAPRPSRRRAVVLVLALVAIAGIALLTFGGIHNFGGRQPSVTTRLPNATTAGAAVNNLPPPNLLKPVSPDEAVKENSERPFVARPDSPASRFVLKAAEADRERALTCLTQAIYYEAASEGADGGRAVAQIVINRMRHPGFPASICGVVYEGSDRVTGCQFTFTCDGSLLRPHVDALWTRSQKIAKEALAGHVFAPVGHATHYHADYVLPYWADSLDKTVQIGRHIFYRLRGSVGDKGAFFQRYAGFEPPIPAPRPAIIVPPPTPAEQQQLATALIGEDAKGPAKDAEKIATAATPLLIDGVPSTLIADGGATPTPVKHARPSTACPSESDGKRLTPLAATDLHAGLASPSC